MLDLWIGRKTEIPAGILEELIPLLQEMHEEENRLPAPHPDHYRRSVPLPPRSTTNEWWVIARHHVDGIIGYGQTFWNVSGNNLDRAHIVFYVTKTQRRQGFGTQILRALLKQLPSCIKTVASYANVGSDGEGFAHNIHGRTAYRERYCVSKIREFKVREIEEEALNLKTCALEKGYDIVCVENGQFDTTVNFAEFVKLVERIINDMPKEDMDMEDDILTEDEQRDNYERWEKAGKRVITYVAVVKATGEPIGLTQTIVGDHYPQVASQIDTGVRKDHRGNKLGLTLKTLLLLKLLTDTQVEYWKTGNASSNVHMIRINDALGHKDWTRECTYEFTTEQWHAIRDSS